MEVLILGNLLVYVEVNNTACSFFLVLQKWVLCLR